MNFTKNLSKALFLGIFFVVGSLNGICAGISIESQIISPISHSMKTITTETFQKLDRDSQNHFIELSIIVLSNPEIIDIVLERIARRELVFPVPLDSKDLLTNIVVLYTKLQEKAISLETKVTKTDTSTKLDSGTLAEIHRVVSPENMQKIASRNASDNASIHVLTGYVSELCYSKVPNSNTFRKLRSKIERLLQDESPNKDWILSLISELQYPEATKKFYDELYTMIME